MVVIRLPSARGCIMASMGRYNRARVALVPAFALLFPLVLGSWGAAAAAPLEDRPIFWYEDDRRDIPEPSQREPNLMWDMVNDSVVLPFIRITQPGRLARRVGSIFGCDHVPPASNVNSLGEVPNSTWFTNRLGLFALTLEDVARSPGEGTGPDMSAPWTVISAKTEGVTPGFVIRDAVGGVYLIKFDPPGHLGMTTGAGVICNRILHAAGYNVPDDAIVNFRPHDLVLGEGVKLKLPGGAKRLMTADDLTAILDGVGHLPDGRYRAISSKFVEGKPIGPFDYWGRRGDDPNDQIDHQNRRELRGLRIFAAWLNHFDAKQHNSLDVYVTEGGRGYVRHYLIDFASTLGAGASGPVPRYGNEFTLDAPAIFGRALALGFHDDVWRHLSRPEGLDEIGYFESSLFDPLEFKAMRPNSAFADMTDRDGYWAAKIISAFTDAQLETIAAQAHYRNPEAARYIARVLAERRDKIARAFFDRIAPLDFFIFNDGLIEFHDLGAERGIYPGTSARYRARFSVVAADRSALRGSDWAEFTETVISLTGGAVLEMAALSDESCHPFYSVECQVDRGNGWSRSVRVYISRRSGRVVALDR